MGASGLAVDPPMYESELRIRLRLALHGAPPGTMDRIVVTNDWATHILVWVSYDDRPGDWFDVPNNASFPDEATIARILLML